MDSNQNNNQTDQPPQQPNISTAQPGQSASQRSSDPPPPQQHPTQNQSSQPNQNLPKKKGMLGKIIAGVIILILLSVSAVAGYTTYQNITTQEPEEQACTLEAKVCPDGSTVGRTGPNCEFSPCPTAKPESEAENSSVSWEEAVSFIRDCEVEQVFQTHSLEVTLTLNDGSRVTTTEPAIDDVFEIVQEAENECGTIPLATE